MHGPRIVNDQQTTFEGLEMLVNMKPVVEDINTKYTPYTLGISTKNNLIDQKRGLINLKPGYKISLKIVPHEVDCSHSFKQFDQKVRKCGLPEDISDFKLLKNYTKAGCEFECAFKKALKVCQCIPWNFPNDYKEYPMCDMFANKCFDLILSDETNYKKCHDRCLDDCSATAFTVFPTFVRIDFEEICQTKLFNQIFKKLLKRYDYYHHYDMIVHSRLKLVDRNTTVRGLNKMMDDTEFCHDYVRKYVSLVEVEASVNSVTKSLRKERVTFTDQLSMVGGTLGLFTGISILSLCEFAIFLLTTIGQYVSELIISKKAK